MPYIGRKCSLPLTIGWALSSGKPFLDDCPEVALLKRSALRKSGNLSGSFPR
jgi:hypothetical protein